MTKSFTNHHHHEIVILFKNFLMGLIGPPNLCKTNQTNETSWMTLMKIYFVEADIRYKQTTGE